jgi:glycosyltransferase involved in cell wall biosynthesis
MVGTVGLRKGAPYVLEAAKTMRGRAEFRVIGSVKVQNALRRELMASLDLRDRVPRSEMPNHFAWADVFLLPSLCEGSATVTYEAMGAGLPVVCTSNTGSLVRDGIDGFIVPVRDTKAIMTCLDALLDPVLRARMSVEARQRARDGTVEAYGKRLVAALGS